MLLETLDIKNNDVVIFSINQFDMENNFKVIFKDDPEKKIRKILYNEVCSFVNEYTPKNIIVYRLLTNIRNFEIQLTKYGFPMYINNTLELIYFDPVFALKELQEYKGAITEELRFRIQQVGVTTLNRHNNLPNFAEIYAVDLHAMEAKNQNDRVFADAIFLKDKTPKKSVKPSPVNPAVFEPPKRQKLQVIDSLIREDKVYDFNEVRKMNYEPKAEKKEPPKTAEKTLKNFLQTKSTTGIFEPKRVNELIKGKEEQPVVLKINRNER